MFRLVPVAGLGCIDVPSATVSLFDTLAIVLLLPLYDAVILPSMRRCCHWQPTQLQRSGVGTQCVAFAGCFCFCWSISIVLVRGWTLHGGRLQLTDDLWAAPTLACAQAV